MKKLAVCALSLYGILSQAAFAAPRVMPDQVILYQARTLDLADSRWRIPARNRPRAEEIQRFRAAYNGKVPAETGRIGASLALLKQEFDRADVHAEVLGRRLLVDMSGTRKAESASGVILNTKNDPCARVQASPLPADVRCERNYVYRLDPLRRLSGTQSSMQTSTVNDPLAAIQWSLRAMNWSPDLDPVQTIRVAILDSGVNATHPELEGRVVASFNAFDGSSDVSDQNGHGSHIAGTIAAIDNNGIGIAGLAPNTELAICKFIDDEGAGSLSELLRCLEWAKSQNVQIINGSWGREGEYSEVEFEAFKSIDDAGIVQVFAAGNEGRDLGDPDFNIYPAEYPLSSNVVVGATTFLDDRTYYSNYGEGVDVFAPGDYIVSLSNVDDGYALLSGSSMAAPHVTGALALYAGFHPELSGVEISAAASNGGAVGGEGDTPLIDLTDVASDAEETPGPDGTPSATPAGTISISPTATPDGTISATPTGTISATPTGTISVTPTGTVSVTPTGTRSATPTGTISATPTGTISITPTGTVSTTPTGTISTRTPTPSVTATVAATRTATGTPTRTTSPTATPRGTRTPIRTASPTATPRQSATPFPTFVPTSTRTPFPVPTAISSRTPIFLRTPFPFRTFPSW